MSKAKDKEIEELTRKLEVSNHRLKLMLEINEGMRCQIGEFTTLPWYRKITWRFK